jgi:hypothetical protein
MKPFKRRAASYVIFIIDEIWTKLVAVICVGIKTFGTSFKQVTLSTIMSGIGNQCQNLEGVTPLCSEIIYLL